MGMPKPAELPLHERITRALREILDAGEEAKRRGYELPPAAAGGVVALNVLAVVIRGQEEGREISPAEVTSMMAATFPDVAVPPAFRRG